MSDSQNKSLLLRIDSETDLRLVDKEHTAGFFALIDRSRPYLRAISSFGFGELKLNRIEIRCATGNTASQAVPTALGFQREGVLRDSEWLYDHFVDHEVFGMLAADWKG